jgi:hypothetical protein
MNSQALKVEPPKISKRIKAVTIGGITLMCAMIFIAVVAYCYNYYPDQIMPELEFTMRQGDRREVRDSNLVLELSDIKDNRCPTDANVMCVWEGGIQYVFHVSEKEIILGTVTDLKNGEKIDKYVLRYISGDEKQGVFVLQKNEK